MRASYLALLVLPLTFACAPASSGMTKPVTTGIARPDTTATTGRSAGATTYYVSPHGSDGAAGTSPSTAWRSLARASDARLAPGDTLALARGGRWSGSLRVASSGTAARPVTVTSYGAGALPSVTGQCVDLAGSYVTASYLATHGCTYAGVLVTGDHDTVTHVVTSHNISGITLRAGSDDDRVLANRVVANNRMAPDTPGPNDDYGAFGVEVQGNRAEVAWNVIRGSVAKSADYGTDGSAVEIYGSHGTVVDHNRAYGDLAFSELGKAGTSGTTYAYNLVRSALPNAAFLVTRGPGDSFGPVRHTVAVHDTAVLTGRGSEAFWCGGVCNGSILSLSDDLFEATARIGTAQTKHGESVLAGGHNIFWGTGTTGGGVRFAASDRVLRPDFLSKLLLTLRPASPAIDAGTVSPRWHTDVFGHRVPVDGDGDGHAAADVGAVEYQR